MLKKMLLLKVAGHRKAAASPSYLANTLIGAGIGSAGGAGIGALIQALRGKSILPGLGIGAGIGALGGGAVGYGLTPGLSSSHAEARPRKSRKPAMSSPVVQLPTLSSVNDSPMPNTVDSETLASDRKALGLDPGSKLMSIGDLDRAERASKLTRERAEQDANMAKIKEERERIRRQQNYQHYQQIYEEQNQKQEREWDAEMFYKDFKKDPMIAIRDLPRLTLKPFSPSPWNKAVSKSLSAAPMFPLDGPGVELPGIPLDFGLGPRRSISDPSIMDNITGSTRGRIIAQPERARERERDAKMFHKDFKKDPMIAIRDLPQLTPKPFSLSPWHKAVSKLLPAVPMVPLDGPGVELPGIPLDFGLGPKRPINDPAIIDNITGSTRGRIIAQQEREKRERDAARRSARRELLNPYNIFNSADVPTEKWFTPDARTADIMQQL